MNLKEIYKNTLVRHYREQHGAILKDPFIFDVVKVSPTCGDEINLRIHATNDNICDISYEISGCTISQSSSSIMHDLCHGKSISDVLNLYKDVCSFMNNKTSVITESIGEVAAFEEVRKYPGRVRCVLLSWEALVSTLNTLENN